LKTLYRAKRKQENAHPDMMLLVACDLNAVKLNLVLPNFYQHDTCATIDHLYSIHRDDDKALPCTPFSKYDHNSILLIPAYKQKLKQEVPVTHNMELVR
jgi:hypothetical protein